MTSTDLLITGGLVLTGDAALGDLHADVLVRDGRIAAVAPDLVRPPGADVLDAADALVLPGFVDTHRHVWQGVLGGIAGGVGLGGYFGTVLAGLAPRLTPDDVHAGVLWGALQALDAGVTTVVDWSHITTTPEHADANVQALHDSGIRGTFLYGPPVGAGLAEWFVDSDLRHPADARRLREEHFAVGTNGRLTMGLALRGPDLSTFAAARDDLELAVELDLPASIHCGFAGSARNRSVARLAEAGLLRPRLNLAHANLLDDEEWRRVAACGATVSACPTVDLLMGLGTWPAVGRAREHGVVASLGVDTVCGAGTDLLSEARLALAAERARTAADAVARDEGVEEVVLAHREALALATLEGARAWGLEDEVGSLVPGKAADVVILRADGPRFTPWSDPATAVVANAGAADIEAVVVGGEVVKRDGRLVGPRVVRAREQADASRVRLLGPAAVPA